MQRVMDLPGWPPQSAGGGAVPLDQVLIERVTNVTDTNVSFTGLLDGRTVQLNFFAADVNTAGKIAKILEQSHGKKLREIEAIEVEPDGS